MSGSKCLQTAGRTKSSEFSFEEDKQEKINRKKSSVFPFEVDKYLLPV